METKKCTKCGIEKPLTEFNFKNKSLGKYCALCRECQRARQRELYNIKYKYTSVLKHRENRKRRRQKIMKLLELIKSSGCAICGEKDTACLDFHHIKDKDFNLALAKEYSIERITKELEKCIILCANCHRKLHAGKILLPDSGSESLQGDYCNNLNKIKES